MWCKFPSTYLLQGNSTCGGRRCSSRGRAWQISNWGKQAYELFVFEGDCTCCFRKRDGMKCDTSAYFLRGMTLVQQVPSVESFIDEQIGSLWRSVSLQIVIFFILSVSTLSAFFTGIVFSCCMLTL